MALASHLLILSHVYTIYIYLFYIQYDYTTTFFIYYIEINIDIQYIHRYCIKLPTLKKAAKTQKTLVNSNPWLRAQQLSQPQISRVQTSKPTNDMPWYGHWFMTGSLYSTLQGINISHLGKRKIIFKMPFLGDMLVPWRVTHYNPEVDTKLRLYNFPSKKKTQITKNLLSLLGIVLRTPTCTKKCHHSAKGLADWMNDGGSRRSTPYESDESILSIIFWGR